MSHTQDIPPAIRRALAELELVSHAPTKNYDGPSRRSTDESIGGKRPPGSDHEHPDRRDIDEWGAWMDSYHRRTVDHYRARLASCVPEDHPVILAEIQQTIRAWRTAPVPLGHEPDYGTPQWKRYIAASTEDAGVLAKRFHCSRRWINMVRQQEGVVTPQRADLEAKLVEKRAERAA